MHLLTGLCIYIKTQIVGRLLALASKTSGLGLGLGLEHAALVPISDLYTRNT